MIVADSWLDILILSIQVLNSLKVTKTCWNLRDILFAALGYGDYCNTFSIRYQSNYYSTLRLVSNTPKLVLHASIYILQHAIYLYYTLQFQHNTIQKPDP